jgi:hypothetical protein
MNKSINIGCALLLLLNGCLLGDRYATERITVRLPHEDRRTTGEIGSDDPRVQEALQFLDTVLGSKGLARNQSRSVPLEEGRIADYGGAPFVCKVYLRKKELVVFFVETRISRSSPEMESVAKQVGQALKERYGEKVKSEHAEANGNQ